MANQLGSLKTAPRSYREHERHDSFVRSGDRHSKQFKTFLAAEATRLSSTSATIFAKVEKYGVERVKAATNISQLP